eukprot:755776-Hanusia_phi.AAC.1
MVQVQGQGTVALESPSHGPAGSLCPIGVQSRASGPGRAPGPAHSPAAAADLTAPAARTRELGNSAGPAGPIVEPPVYGT